MSSLIHFDILSKKEAVLEVKVTIIHPDEHLINNDFSFAFQIILEQFSNIEKGYIYNSNWQNYPFTEEESKSFLSENTKKELSRLKELANGREIPITEEIYKEISQSKEWTYKDQKITSMGSVGDNYSLTLEPSYDKFCEEIEQYIESVEVLGHNNYPHWFDRLEVWIKHEDFYGLPEDVYEEHNSQVDPSYVLKITFKSPDLLEHMKERASWSSAAFSFEGYYAPNYKPNYTKHQKFLLDPTDMIEMPSDEVLLLWWKGLSDNWKDVLQRNLYLQQRELAPYLVRHILGRMITGGFDNIYGTISFQEPDIQDLRNMILMKALFASGAQLKTLEPIKMLQGLKLLDLEANDIKDISPLSILKQLAYLNLYSCDKIEGNLTTLGSLKALQTIYYDQNSQADIDVLFSLPKLKDINFFAPFELNGEGFIKLKQLKKLSGYSEGVTNKTLEVARELHNRGVKINWEISEEGDKLEFE